MSKHGPWCSSSILCALIACLGTATIHAQDLSLHEVAKDIVLAGDIARHDPLLKTSAPGPTSNRYLVLLDPKTTRSTEEFQNHLNEMNIPHRVTLDMTQLVPDVFYGLSVELDHPEDAERLEESAHVVRMNGVTQVKPIDTFDRKILHEPVRTKPGEYPPHIQTNITQLHQMGIYGQGIKIALIDSGIDCKHPALGGGFGKGHKVSFGKNFVPAYKGTPDDGRPTPCSPCSTHGTHVAGIVGANDVGYGFHGVAPNATLGMYLFGCEGHSSGSNDIILSAILHAHKDGADIISASLGGPGGWGQGELILDTINKLVTQKGMIIFFAAGNEGSEGLFYGDSPASAAKSISVGSVDASDLIVANFKASTGHNLTYYTTSGFDDKRAFPVYVTAKTLNDSEDACKPLPKDTPDLGPYVVLIRRGTCLFSIKVEHAKAKGAKRILFAMNSTAIVTLPTTMKNVTVAVMSEEDGKYVVSEAHKDPKNFKLSFPKTQHFYLPTPEGGFMSNFSQFGPTFDMESPQPAVSGVGGNVVSTYPMEEGAYASLSGTSMATPQLAGIAALIMSVRGKNFTGTTMQSRLATTATRILSVGPRDNRPHTAVHQGGGLVNALCAVFANTTLSTAALSLNDSVHFNGTHEFIISNTGPVPIDYSLTHLPAVGVSTFSNKTEFHRPDVSPALVSVAANADIVPTAFTLAPGSHQRVQVHFTPPVDAASASLLSIYSGFIALNTDHFCEKHHLPYFGVLGSLKAQDILDRGPNKNSTHTYPYLSKPKENKKKTNDDDDDDGDDNDDNDDDSMEPLSQGIQFSRNGSVIWERTRKNGTYLILNYRTLFGSPLVRVDVAPGNSVFSDASNSKDWEHKFRGVNLLGLLPDSDSPVLSRSPANDFWVQSWNSSIMTVKKKKPVLLPSGDYKLLLRALKVTGSAENDEDFDYWVSPQIHLLNK